MKKKIIITIFVISLIFVIKFGIEMPAIFCYNHANNLYNSGKYEEAIKEYEKALELFPSKDKECKIRINLTLANLKKLEKEELRERKLAILEKSKEILTKKGCASANGDEKQGHSKDAEKLKQEIEDEIERLTLKSEINKNHLENNSQVEENKENEKQEENLKKLEKIQKEGSTQRKNNLDKETSGNITYGSGKNW